MSISNGGQRNIVVDGAWMVAVGNVCVWPNREISWRYDTNAWKALVVDFGVMGINVWEERGHMWNTDSANKMIKGFLEERVPLCQFVQQHILACLPFVQR